MLCVFLWLLIPQQEDISGLVFFTTFNGSRIVLQLWILRAIAVL